MLRPWPLIFDHKHRGVYLCPKMHQSWKFGEIQSSNFQDTVSRRKSALFSMLLDPPWPWTLIFWSPKLDAFILVPKRTNAESLAKISPTVSKKLLTTFPTHGQTKTDSRTAWIHNASGHYVGEGIIKTLHRCFSRRWLPVPKTFVHYLYFTCNHGLVLNEV